MPSRSEFTRLAFQRTREARVLLRLKKNGMDVAAFRLIPLYRLIPGGPVTVGLVVPSRLVATKRQKVGPFVKWRFNWLYAATEEMNQDMDEREGVGHPVVEPYWPD